MKNRGINPRPRIARLTGPHMIVTEVETLDEALTILKRRGEWRKAPRKNKVTVQHLCKLGNATTRDKKQNRAWSPLHGPVIKEVKEPRKSLTSNKGYPQVYHTVCGRCGTPREQAITKLCPFYMKTKCLGELLRTKEGK